MSKRGSVGTGSEQRKRGRAEQTQQRGSSGGMAAAAGNGAEGMEIDEALHSRQLAVYGREVMKRITGANVLVCGANGLGVEVGACVRMRVLHACALCARVLHACACVRACCMQGVVQRLCGRSGSALRHTRGPRAHACACASTPLCACPGCVHRCAWHAH